MGLEAEKPADDAAARLIAAGRTLLAQGDAAFSLTRLCSEAGVTLADFRASFSGKADLLQQLMDRKPEPPQADPWLERRLRVFERALSALEEKADARDRHTRDALARMEEKLAALDGAPVPLTLEEALDRPVPFQPRADAEPGAPVPQTEPVEAAEPVPEQPNPLLLEPLQPAPPVKLDAEVLDQARRAARAHGRKQQKKRRAAARIPERMLVAGTLAILILCACAALTLVNAGAAPVQAAGGATAMRAMPDTPLARLVLRAQAGDAQAQRALAQAYLKGEGIGKDIAAARMWAQAGAEGGDVEAQYLYASLLRSGAAREAKAALDWFGRAAHAGDVQAMHSMGLAYALGEGVARDESQAAAWFAKAASRGFVDAAFNLAVLYERGHGVAQDPRQALRWYRAAAQAGDKSAAARARILAQQARL